ncbi:unnamed protein product [Lactuca saligna]|uniref:Inositol polyphosphate multikinase n=1 Tax=Lactuca saligna TaxID=75948 RepID=A0AA35YV50_LACSI|nr:unnamed protein product [Lactuca saligna]
MLPFNKLVEYIEGWYSESTGLYLFASLLPFIQIHSRSLSISIKPRKKRIIYFLVLQHVQDPRSPSCRTRGGSWETRKNPTWAPEASEEYITKCLKKDRESTSVSLGYRLSGLRVFIGDELGFYKPERDVMRKAGPDDVRLFLMKFVSSNLESESGSESKPDCSLVASVYGGDNGILSQLLELKAWFEDQTVYHFYACSLLFMFEKGLTSNPEVKLIDFAHVEEGKGVIDHNFLGGLCSLIKFISDILSDTNDLKNGLIEP